MTHPLIRRHLLRMALRHPIKALRYWWRFRRLEARLDASNEAWRDLGVTTREAAEAFRRLAKALEGPRP